MDKLVLTIGCNVEGDKTHSTTFVEDTALTVLQLQGATFKTCNGVWCGERETSVIVEICDDAQELKRVISLVPQLAATLNQNCIMQEYFTDVAVEFIAAENMTNKAVN
jgi:hypothetical protein